jgi:hypothetical protein
VRAAALEADAGSVAGGRVLVEELVRSNWSERRGADSVHSPPALFSYRKVRIVVLSLNISVPVEVLAARD